MRQRILVISHGHPDFNLGGAEIAAYNLFKAYKKRADVEDACFLARSAGYHGVSGQIRKRRESEYLWEQSISDWHMLKAANQHGLTRWFPDFIKDFKPTIVHMHHFAHIGLETISAIKQVDSSIRIFLTLHEYFAICKHNGLMVKRGRGYKLCSTESANECQQCFPDYSAEEILARKHYVRKHFEHIDGFISPSEFLKQRYVNWGIVTDKIAIIENGQQDLPVLPPRKLVEGERRNRFAYFGRVKWFKGIELLLKALNSMERSEREKIKVEIHGSSLEKQTGMFQHRIKALSEELIKEKCLRWVGPYNKNNQFTRMQNIDWVIVPSIWWENSPMVIQEAFVAGRPPIVSNIGGMKEKVNDGVDGVHFNARDPLDLANKLLRLVESDTTWDKLRSGIQKPLTHDECADAHMEVFCTF